MTPSNHLCKAQTVCVAPGGFGKKRRDMQNVNVKFLRTFLALVEERSTAKAARRLGMTRPSVLNHIAALEKVLGRRLLERRFPPKRAETGRTQLTDAGRALLPKAAEVVRAHDRLFADVPVGQDAREEADRAVAAGLIELARNALRRDLSEDDRKRIHEILLSS